MDDTANVPPAPRPAVRRLAVAAGAARYTVCFPLIVEFGVAWYLTARQHETSDASPVYFRLWKAYRPFAIQHPHPFYFFFPLDSRERVVIGNEICSLDEYVFCRPGPDVAADRKLGFLLGASAAFGAYASSNAATISAYLNPMQNEFRFVNAGVPP